MRMFCTLPYWILGNPKGKKKKLLKQSTPPNNLLLLFTLQCLLSASAGWDRRLFSVLLGNYHTNSTDNFNTLSLLLIIHSCPSAVHTEVHANQGKRSWSWRLVRIYDLSLRAIKSQLEHLYMCHSVYSWSNHFFSFLETEVRRYIRVRLRVTAPGLYLCTEKLLLLGVHAAFDGQGKLLIAASNECSTAGFTLSGGRRQMYQDSHFTVKIRILKKAILKLKQKRETRSNVCLF